MKLSMRFGEQRELLQARETDLHLTIWEENDISGRPLTEPIFAELNQSDIVFADITHLNFNVTF